MLILEQIVSFKKDEISRKKNELLQIKKKVSRSSKKGHDFLAALKEPGLSIIAEFKQMIKSLHQAGLRVIMDVVYNHMYGGSPFVQMYWNSETNEPADNSAWFNYQCKVP